MTDNPARDIQRRKALVDRKRTLDAEFMAHKGKGSSEMWNERNELKAQMAELFPALLAALDDLRKLVNKIAGSDVT